MNVGESLRNTGFSIVPIYRGPVGPRTVHFIPLGRKKRKSIPHSIVGYVNFVFIEIYCLRPRGRFQTNFTLGLFRFVTGIGTTKEDSTKSRKSSKTEISKFQKRV